MLPSLAFPPPGADPLITPVPKMPSSMAAGMPSASPTNAPSCPGVWQSTMLLFIITCFESLVLEIILLCIRHLKRDIETAASRRTNFRRQPRQVVPFGTSPCFTLPALCLLLMIGCDEDTAYKTMVFVTFALGLLTLVASIHAAEIGTRDLRASLVKVAKDDFEWAKSSMIWTYEKAKAWFPKIKDIALLMSFTISIVFLGYINVRYGQSSSFSGVLLLLIGLKALFSTYPVAVSAFWRLAPEEDLHRCLKRATDTLIHDPKSILNFVKANGRKVPKGLVAMALYLAFVMTIFGWTVVQSLEVAMGALQAKELLREMKKHKSDQTNAAIEDQEATETFEEAKEFEDGTSDETIVEQEPQESNEPQNDDDENIENRDVVQALEEEMKLGEPQDIESIGDETSSDEEDWVVV